MEIIIIDSEAHKLHKSLGIADERADELIILLDKLIEQTMTETEGKGLPWSLFIQRYLRLTISNEEAVFMAITNGMYVERMNERQRQKDLLIVHSKKANGEDIYRDSFPRKEN